MAPADSASARSALAVEFRAVSRRFGARPEQAVRAVDGVSFTVAAGEFFAMLGPSGSGKTTCLRLIAGFERPDAGAIFIHGEPAAGKPPYLRDVNTVFQDYALFPHLTVADNIAYGPMVRGVDKTTRQRRAAEMLELVKLGGLGARRPAQLSGGQRQRVALARALINQPKVLLLDEPLGALDLKLREQMQVELKNLQRQLGITFIYVTHDQAEALSMSDRLAVFNHGRIEQIGAPGEVYENPATAFVAGFVGVANILNANAARVLLGEERGVLTQGALACGALALRPEKIQLQDPAVPAANNHCTALGTVRELHYQGAHSRYQIALTDGLELSVLRPNVATAGQFAPGARVRLSWRREDLHPLRDTPR